MTINNQSNEYALSVVVGTLNRLDLLMTCIDSVVSQTTIPVRIYVTDAGSTDGTIEYLRSIASDCILVTYLGRKVGQARAYNEIFKQVTTPYVCWLSDDNEIVNHSLDIAVKILEENPKIGMVGLKIRDVQGPFASAPYIGGVSQTGILNVNQGVLRTELLQRLGGFSEEFMDYGIDPDLTARVLYSGNAVAYTKKISILHYRDWGQSDALAAQLEKQANYQILYKQKYGHRLKNSKLWLLKKSLYAPMRKIGIIIAACIGSDRVACLSRDWYNILTARHIGLFDHLQNFNKQFHLLQYCPEKCIIRSPAENREIPLK